MILGTLKALFRRKMCPVCLGLGYLVRISDNEQVTCIVCIGTGLAYVGDPNL
jgi:hypothetical protein